MSDLLDKILVKDPQFYITLEGRVSRERYALSWFLPMFAVWFFIVLIFGVSSPICGLFSLITLWPNIALNARRLHDRGKSGWLQLFLLIPIIGFLWWVWDVLAGRGDEGANEYGDVPERPLGKF